MLFNLVPSIKDNLICFNYEKSSFLLNTNTMQLIETDIVTLKDRVSFSNIPYFNSNNHIIKSNIITQNNLRFKDRSIRNLIIMPTFDCHLSCAYCYMDKDKIYLSKEILDDTIYKNSINTNNVNGIILIGGEPLLNFDICEYVLSIFNNANITICTSLFFNIEILNKIILLSKIYNNFELSVSLDRIRYDEIKFNTVLKNILYLKDNNVNIRIKSVIDYDHYDVEEIRFLTGLNVSFDGVGYTKGKFLDKDSRLKNIVSIFNRELENVLSGNIKFEDSFICYGEDVSWVINNIGSSAEQCGCGINTFTILPNGDLSFCDSGKNDALDDNLYSAQLYNKINDIKEPCSSCNQLGWCGGSCEVYSSGEYNIFCTIKQLRFSYAMYYKILMDRYNND